MTAANSVSSNAAPCVPHSSREDGLCPLSRRPLLEKMRISFLTQDAMKDRHTDSPLSNDRGDVTVKQQIRPRGAPFLSAVSCKPVLLPSHVPISTRNPGEFDCPSNQNLPPLPSFRVLEESIRSQNCFKKRPIQRCGYTFPDPPSAKRRRVEASDQPFTETRQKDIVEPSQSIGHKFMEAMVSETNPVIEKSDSQNEKHQSFSGCPQILQNDLPKPSQTPVSMMRVRELINPDTEPAPIVNTQQATSGISADAASISFRNRSCYQPYQSFLQQKVETAAAPTSSIPPSVPHAVNSVAQNSQNATEAAHNRFYDLAKIQRLGYKVINGRVYNEHNLPICSAPRENGSPCRRNVSKSACKWHGKVIPLTSRNTKNGQLDSCGCLLPPSSTQNAQSFVPSPPDNPVLNQYAGQTHVPQTASKRKPQSRGLRWDNEEHFWFLLGYKKLGKKWSKVSKIIKTRTALQTQSHAQKHFERRSNMDKKKNTIHDLSLDSPEIQAIATRIPKEEQEARLALGDGDERASRN